MLDKQSIAQLTKRIKYALLDFDSLIDSSLYNGGQRFIRWWESFGAHMDRLHVSGLSRLCVEFACEGLTLGLGGALIMTALAIPAFHETSDDWLKKQDLAVTFLDRYGQEVGRRGIRHDDSVPLEQMPDYFIRAVLATEDRRFYDHVGIDPIGLMRALSVNARASGVVQGGSSITQQLAKNLFLNNQRTLERKIKEAFLALWLENHVSKHDILKLYFDRAYLGGGAFGVQAAAQFYFGKSIRDVTLAEATMLAGLFKAPTKYAPHINLPAARARANDVLSNLVDAGFMTEGQVYAARRNPATPVNRKRDSSPDWYLDWAYDDVKKMADRGLLGSERVLIVRTALDSELQRHAEHAIEESLRQSGRQYNAHQGAAVVMEPTGAVRAIVGGRDYGASQFNRATDAARQPGSSFKPFVYFTALMTGKFNATTIVEGGDICIGNWCPHNYGGAHAGRMPLVSALQASLNTVAVRLSIAIGEYYWPKDKSYHQARIAELGRSKIIETARIMGLTTPLPDTVSLPLGADDVKMIDMASAYAVFANGGTKVVPYAALEVRNSRNEVIWYRDRDAPEPPRLWPAEKIAEMNNMLKEVVAAGTARAAQLPGVVAAGKTGTTNAYKDAWFDGFTGNFVGSVWFGNDDDTSMNNMTGGSLPARTWHEIMAFTHQGVELKNPYGVTSQPPPLIAAQTTASPTRIERQSVLSKKTKEALGSLMRMFDAIRDEKRASL